MARLQQLMTAAAAVVLFTALSSPALSQGPIEMVSDRPLTWDWTGCIPVTSKLTPDSRFSKLLALMKSGDYYNAYVEAKNHLKSNPNDYEDVWVMLESARKRKAKAQLLSDASGLRGETSSPALDVLYVRALNMFLMERITANDPDAAKIAGLEADERKALQSLETTATSDLAALTTYLSAHEAVLTRARDLAIKYRDLHKGEIEGELLVVRSLLRGSLDSTVAPGPHGKTGPLRSAGTDRGPEVDKALAELKAAEAHFGKNDFLTYYNAAALSLKADISDPAEVNVAALRAQAMEAATEFVKHGDGFPRMSASAKKYLQLGRFYAFFPWPDE